MLRPVQNSSPPSRCSELRVMTLRSTPLGDHDLNGYSLEEIDQGLRDYARKSMMLPEFKEVVEELARSQARAAEEVRVAVPDKVKAVKNSASLLVFFTHVRLVEY